MNELPFLPYARQQVEEDDIAAVVEVLRSDYLTTGPRVPAFEAALAEATGAPWAVAVSSGTAALHAACFAAGVGAGDEVVVPAVTFAASANCARFLGAKVVFAEVDPETGLAGPQHVAERLSDRTRAVLAVHLGGASADVPAMARLAGARGAAVIEDAAHALGGERASGPVGACSDGGRLAAFSFHPVKHVAAGEGGAVTGRDPELERRLRLFRDHGIEREPGRMNGPVPGPWHYELQLLGHNLRLSDLHAALGRSQLAKLGRFLGRRRALAARYDRLLAGMPGVRPGVAPPRAAGAAYHLYTVQMDFTELGLERREVMAALRAEGIGTQVHYIPLPAQPYYRGLGADPEEYPGAMRYFERTLSLPLFPAMRDEDVDRVVGALAGVLARPAGRKG